MLWAVRDNVEWINYQKLLVNVAHGYVMDHSSSVEQRIHSRSGHRLSARRAGSESTVQTISNGATRTLTKSFPDLTYIYIYIYIYIYVIYIYITIIYSANLSATILYFSSVSATCCQDLSGLLSQANVQLTPAATFGVLDEAAVAVWSWWQGLLLYRLKRNNR